MNRIHSKFSMLNDVRFLEVKHYVAYKNLTPQYLLNRIYSKNSMLNYTSSAKTNLGGELVKVQLIYESLCPDCRNFFTNEFKDAVLEIGSYLDVHFYPFGNAEVAIDGNGRLLSFCEHGPAEYYGNKLHACAIDVLQNITSAFLFTSCLMDESRAHGSNDKAADECGASMNIDPAPIKHCAKSNKGFILFLSFGFVSMKAAPYSSVPYILVNGVPSTPKHFKADICKALTNPPPQCKNTLLNDQPEHSTE